MLAHTIDTLLEVDCFERVMVSTDSPRIAEIALAYGAEVPFLRSARNAGKNANLLDAVAEVLDNLRDLDGFVPHIIGIFLPTAPFRRRASVKDVFTRVAQGAQAGNMVRRVHMNGANLFFRSPKGRIKKWAGPKNNPARLAAKEKAIYFRDNMSVAIRLVDWTALLSQGITPQTKRYFRHYLAWFRTNQYTYVDTDDLACGMEPKGHWIYEAYACHEESIDINPPADMTVAREICSQWNDSAC